MLEPVRIALHACYRTLAISGGLVNPDNGTVYFGADAFPKNVSIMQLPIRVDGVSKVPVVPTGIPRAG